MNKRIGILLVLLIGFMVGLVEGVRAQEQPVLSLPKEPVLSLPKEPVLSLPKEPVLSLPKEPFTFEPSDCMFPGIEAGVMNVSADSLGFECGYVTVPAEHANPDGPTIRIPVAILRATGTNPQPDPLFLAQGGPGGDAFELFSFYLPESSLRRDRDLVVINQRGTIYAEPDLRCTEIADNMGELLSLPLEPGTERYNELLQACYQRLADDGVNLSAFDSVENAADMEAVRQALGYDDINFYGVSYGTLLGLHLMRDYPDHLRSVMLDGVVPTSSNFIASLPENENRVYTELFSACAADTACAADYPNLPERYQALIDQLNADPVTLTLTDPDTGEQAEALLDGVTLAGVMYQVLYLPEAYAIFPKIVANAEAGDFVFLQRIWPLFAFDRTSSYGMYYSVICAEDGDFDVTAVSAETYPPFIANKLVDELQSYLDACTLWPVELLPAAVDEPVTSDLPVLLMSGRFDPITPPAFAEEAAQTLPNSTHVVDPWASHSIAFNDDCVNAIMADFLANPDQTLDTSCLAAKQSAGFVPANAITVPLLGPLSQLESGVMTQIALSALLLLAILGAVPVWFVAWLIQSGKSDRRVLTSQEKRLRWTGRLLVIGYGLLGMLYASALTAVLFIPLLDASPTASLLSVPGNTWPIFAAAWLLVLLAIGMVVTAVLYWRQAWSVWRKLYYSFVALCAVGYVVMLGANGLLTVLF